MSTSYVCWLAALWLGGGACRTIVGCGWYIESISWTLCMSGASWSQWCSPQNLHSYIFGWIALWIFCNEYKLEIYLNLTDLTRVYDWMKWGLVPHQAEIMKKNKDFYFDNGIASTTNYRDHSKYWDATKWGCSKTPSNSMRPCGILIFTIVIRWWFIA